MVGNEKADRLAKMGALNYIKSQNMPIISKAMCWWLIFECVSKENQGRRNARTDCRQARTLVSKSNEARGKAIIRLNKDGFRMLVDLLRRHCLLNGNLNLIDSLVIDVGKLWQRCIYWRSVSATNALVSMYLKLCNQQIRFFRVWTSWSWWRSQEPRIGLGKWSEDEGKND